MAYTPPGVYTEVEIANNIVQLPGGTRIPAFIGTGRKYKSVTGEEQVQPINRLATLDNIPVRSIQNVYDFSGSGGALNVYPSSGAGTFNSGWYQSGNNLAWTSANNPYPTSTTPAIGATYYVTYSGVGASGTVSSPVTDTLVQNSTHQNILSSGTGAWTFLGVSGASITYYASGSSNNSGTDSSGFAKDGSGYNETASGTVFWSAATGIAYPSATVVPISGVFFVDYTFNKTGTAYSPKNFTDYTQVVSEYGPDAEWSLITSGQHAGSYQFLSLNPLTIASRLAFANGASIVNLTQMSGNGLTTGEFQNSLNQLQAKTVDVIVPLTVGSGASLFEISVPTKSSILTAVDLHCVTMSLPQNKKERVSIGSLGVAEIGDVDTPDTYVYTASQVLDDKRIALIAPGKTVVEIQDPNGEFQQIEVDAAFLAVAMSALSCNPNFDVATPLTNKQFLGFDTISAETVDHPMQEYLESEKNILAAAGVCVIDRTGSKIFIRHQLTTDQANVAVGEFSVVTTTDYVSQAVRFTTEQFIGKKLVNAIVVPAVKSTILSTMAQLIQAQIINAVGAITVQVDPNNPTQLLSTVQYVPVFPLNRIKVTFTIRTQL